MLPPYLCLCQSSLSLSSSCSLIHLRLSFSHSFFTLCHAIAVIPSTSPSFPTLIPVRCTGAQLWAIYSQILKLSNCTSFCGHVYNTPTLVPSHALDHVPYFGPHACLNLQKQPLDPHSLASAQLLYYYHSSHEHNRRRVNPKCVFQKTIA